MIKESYYYYYYFLSFLLLDIFSVEAIVTKNESRNTEGVPTQLPPS